MSVFQRCCDLFFSFFAIVALSPILVPVALILRATGEGEVLYQQARIGKGGKSFNLLKFATMLKNSPQIGTGTITVKNDPRILPVGKFLRQTKINELPQLLNVLMGHMSVIGPRPLTRQTFEAYDASSQVVVSRVRPGLSGIGSIVFRQEEELLVSDADPIYFYRNKIAPYKGALEAWYVKNSSVRNYFKLILLTLIVVVFPKSPVVWRSFPDLPVPPDDLKSLLNYSP